MSQPIRPLRDLVHVRELQVAEDKSAGGIILSAVARKPIGPARAVVVAFGKDSNSVAIGDVILFDKFTANDAGDGNYFIKDSLIIAVEETTVDKDCLANSAPRSEVETA